MIDKYTLEERIIKLKSANMALGLVIILLIAAIICAIFDITRRDMILSKPIEVNSIVIVEKEGKKCYIHQVGPNKDENIFTFKSDKKLLNIGDKIIINNHEGGKDYRDIWN